MNEVADKTIRQLSPAPARDCPVWFERWPFARWGWRELNRYGWPLVTATIGMAFLSAPWHWLAVLPAVLLSLLLYFFRDPARKIPELTNAIVAPADGTIVEITILPQYDFLDGPAIRIGIFLSIFNVHINRAPCVGRVVSLHYRPGEFLNALRPESAERNEFMWIGFECTEKPPRRFAVRQISGLLARRIVCPLVTGQPVTRGEKFGMIKLGSRTELILPADAVEVDVRLGQKVHAGSDIVALWK